MKMKALFIAIALLIALGTIMTYAEYNFSNVRATPQLFPNDSNRSSFDFSKETQLVDAQITATPVNLITVDEWAGYQWEAATTFSITLQRDTVNAVLAGIGIVRDYAFDVDPKMYEYYQAYQNFLMREGIVDKIVDDLTRYYKLNHDNYKYKDRVVTMIMVIYGKYWWR
jgi:hypothetical protein